jgi:hypothetical protein
MQATSTHALNLGLGVSVDSCRETESFGSHRAWLTGGQFFMARMRFRSIRTTVVKSLPRLARFLIVGQKVLVFGLAIWFISEPEIGSTR